MIGVVIYTSYLNLGKFLDATSKPIKTDILVCLGGGDYKLRVKKTLELYEQNLSSSKVIILTGNVNSTREEKEGIVEDKRITYLKNNSLKKIHIVLNKDLKNTAQEIRYIKEYMLEHKLKSATFITEPPHSRRILLFSKIISVDDDSDLSFYVVGADYKNWDTDTYYEDKYAKRYAFSESIKMIYGLFVYGVLDKVGLLEWFENNFKTTLKESKNNLNRRMDFIFF